MWRNDRVGLLRLIMAIPQSRVQLALHGHGSQLCRRSPVPNLINWNLLILRTDRVEPWPQNHLPNH
jgi:hypothetical protein